MIYKFKSKAAGDVIMLGPNGDELLRLIGREPAAQGIIEPAAMAGVVAALEAAIAGEEAPSDKTGSSAGEASPEEEAQHRVGLRQRLWPMVEMLKRAQQAQENVVWGV